MTLNSCVYFTPIMPAFSLCLSFLFHTYYSKSFAGKIGSALVIVYILFFEVISVQCTTLTAFNNMPNKLATLYSTFYLCMYILNEGTRIVYL